MIRIILAVIIVLLFFLVGLVTMPLTFLVSKFNKHAGDLMALRLVQWIFKVVLFVAGTKATYVGLENIPTDRPVMYIGNHRSIFDIILTYTKCPDLTGYISKEEIGKILPLKAWMKRLYCIFLDRSNPKAGMKVILTAIDQVKKGISMFVFPEGTRNKYAEIETDLLEFKDGSFKIAQKTGCPVLPVAMINTAEIFENHKPTFKSAKVKVIYGEPIEYSSLTDEQKKHPGDFFQQVVKDMLEKELNN